MPRAHLKTVASVVACLTTISVVVAPASRAAEDVVRATTSYTAADRALGGDVLLWEPTYTAGLRRAGEIDVVAYPSGTSRATFVGSTYGKRVPSFTLAQKGAQNPWAVRPVEHPSERLIETISIQIGPPGAKRPARARIYANCNRVGRAPGNRCERGDVARFGGALVLVARSTSEDSSRATNVRIDSSGLSYQRLVRIATGLRPVD